MPASSFQLPPPAVWQDFESLCHALWRQIWDDPDAQKNGRAGQPQNGVDVFGQAGGRGEWLGVQCKLRDELTGGVLTEDDIVAEVKKAENFRPKIGSFTIATTGPRDQKAQQVARELSEQRHRTGKFSVHVYAWPDILDCLSIRSDVVREFYAQFFLAASTIWRRNGDVFEGVVTGLTSPIEECTELFDAPELRTLVVEELRIELRNIATELFLNAFQHGRARRAEIQLMESSLVLNDDGAAFDPLSPNAARPDGAGLDYLHSFLKKRGGEVKVTYKRSKERNVVSIALQHRLSSELNVTACTIHLKERYLSGPVLTRHADIPVGCSEYRLEIPFGFLNPSSLVELLRRIHAQLPPGAKLLLRFAKNDLLRESAAHFIALGFFDPSVVSVVD